MPRTFKAMLVIFALIVGWWCLWLAKPAHAAQGCGERQVFVDALLKNYHEVPKNIAVGGPYVIEFFLSPEGTFTIIATPTMGGLSCIIVAGKEWTEVKPSAPGQPL